MSKLRLDLQIDLREEVQELEQEPEEEQAERTTGRNCTSSKPSPEMEAVKAARQHGWTSGESVAKYARHLMALMKEDRKLQDKIGGNQSQDLLSEDDCQR